MRLLLGTMMGLALTGLAACGPSEESLRNTTRELMLVGCRNGPASDRAALAQTGVNLDQYCACAVDRTVRTLSAEQLKQISNNPAAVPGMEAAAAQCMAEMMPAAAAATASNEAANAVAELNSAVDAATADLDAATADLENVTRE